jgi:arylsulfatase A-like enzyme
MAPRILDSSWPYFTLAGLLALVAVGSQFEVHVPSRKPAPAAAIGELAARNASEPGLNIVFLLIDTLRADRLGVYGYERDTSPNLDALAEYGIVFENVVSQSTWTKTSMASLWTATHPANNGILLYNHVLPQAATLPAEILAEAGYRTVGIWRNGWVEPNFGFAQGFDVYVRPTPGAERARIHRASQSPNRLSGTDEDLTVAALDFLDQFGDERFFLYLHYMDIHQYVYDEGSAIFGTSYSDAYDQSIRWTDGLIGRLVDHLEEIGVLGRTLIVIGADHGEAFEEHGFEGHARNLYRETTHVPLILLPPFLLEPGVRVSETVSNVDFWPTVLDLLGLPPIPAADGRSALPLIRSAAGLDAAPSAAPPRPAFAQLARGWGNPRVEATPMLSVTLGSERLIATLSDPVVLEYFDHASDPGEQKNRVADHPEAVAHLEALLGVYREAASSPWCEEPIQVELDEMRLNQLRALGYMNER